MNQSQNLTCRVAAQRSAKAPVSSTWHLALSSTGKKAVYSETQKASSWKKLLFRQFLTKKEAFACLNIPQQSVSASRIFLIDQLSQNLTNWCRPSLLNLRFSPDMICPGCFCVNLSELRMARNIASGRWSRPCVPLMVRGSGRFVISES